MLVADLRHFLDLPEDAPAPARHMAEHLANVVRAATAGPTSAAWVSALPCRRRPANRRCSGRITVRRDDLRASIDWQCSACEDAGTISAWQDSPYDLRRHRLAVLAEAHEIVISDQVAAALRDVLFLDPDCERLVFGIRVERGRVILPASEDDLDELVGSVAAEANQQTNRRRQQRFDAAFEALNNAAADRYS